MTAILHPRPPGSDPSLGRQYIPDHHAAPTDRDAGMWSEGAKAALQFAADLVRKALEAGEGPAEIQRRIEASTSVPFTHSRGGYEFETALIVEPGEDATCWLAWTVGPSI